MRTAKPKFQLCKSCRKARSRYSAWFVARKARARRKAGLCARCDRKPYRNQSLCRYHREMNHKWTAISRRRAARG